MPFTLSNFICYFLLYFAEAFILFHYADHVFTFRRRTSVCLLTISITYGILLFFTFFHFTWLNTLLFFVFNAICLQFLTKIPLHVSLFHAAILTVLMGLSEIVLIGINTSLFSLFIVNKSFTPDVLFIAIASKVIYFLLVQFCLLIFWRKKEKSTTLTANLLFLVLIPLLTMVILLTFGLIMELHEISGTLRIMIIVSNMILLLINILITWTYKQNQRKNEAYTNLQLQMQQEHDMGEYYKLLIHQDLDQKILIHDIKKHLNTINLLIKNEKTEQVEDYIRHILNTDLFESQRVSDNDMLNTIISHYIQICKKKEINFHTDIRSKLLTNLNYLDMTALVANLLDNAVEAAERTSYATIDFSVKKVEASGSTMICLSNSCDESPFDDATGKLTTKKDDPQRHGYGLRSIERVVSKYNGKMTMYYKEEEREFHTIILINDLQ